MRCSWRRAKHDTGSIRLGSMNEHRPIGLPLLYRHLCSPSCQVRHVVKDEIVQTVGEEGAPFAMIFDGEFVSASTKLAVGDFFGCVTGRRCREGARRAGL